MKVAIIMGSASDQIIAQKCAQVLADFDVNYEVRVISAHRALNVLESYVASFEATDIDVVIAMAGKAAHLPGVVAALTNKPVIGVPIKGSAFLGLDSLLSIVQMPAGVPVATVAVDAGDNAALLAIKILALKDPSLQAKLQAYKVQLCEAVLTQDKEIQANEWHCRG